MPNDEYNTLEDLVFSRSFRNWVLKGDTSEAAFWTDWAVRNPDRTEVINQAKAVIFALQMNMEAPSAETVDAEVRKVLQKLKDGRVNLVREIPFRPGILRRRPARAWTIAAILATLVITGILAGALRRYLHAGEDNFHHNFLADNTAEPIRQQTAADTAKWVTLPDGSTVHLTPGSKLSYPEGNTGRRRAVFLEGEAFFDITHSASIPFYVYTGNIATKVLGTSFTIHATNKVTTVSVATGKVSVYHKTDLSDGVILTPNQQITYDPEKDRLDKSLIALPVPLTGPDSTTCTTGPTPVATVFRRLQDRYGISILYDEETISRCSLQMPMGNKPFYEKLKIVCKAIGATYEAIDGNIVITANGCK